ncbi:MAG: hypothetical protein RR740_00365 [Pseudomonas sp.]
MIDLLTKYLGKNLPEFTLALKHPEYLEERTMNGHTGVIEVEKIEEIYSRIKIDRGQHWKDLLVFLFSEPRQMIHLATEHSKCVMSSDPAKVKIAMLVENLASNIDAFTRKVGNSRIWGKVYRGPVDVIEVWRTKEDEVVGEPSERKIDVTNIQSNLVAMALMERGTGDSTVCLSLSDGRYREGSRCDHLLDVPAMFSKYGEKAMGLFRDAAPVLENLTDLARILHESGKVELGAGRIKLYGLDAMAYIKRELKPEDAPDALYEVGGWA